MRKKLSAVWTALVFLFLSAACGKAKEPVPLSEEERAAASEAFRSASPMNEAFSLDGVSFSVVRCETSVLYPSASGMRGVYVYIDYPAGLVYPSSALEIEDLDGERYTHSAPDGLDFLGEYRGETPDGLGYARFVLPASYRHFLLTLNGEQESAKVHLVVRDIDEE